MVNTFRIWQDHWLPRKHLPLVSECPIADYEDTTVDILIDPYSRQWNKVLVDGLFNEEDAELIKKIPLSQNASDDILYWPYSSNGLYSCKSGYQFLKMEEELSESAQVTTNEDTQVWKQIWAMWVPQKVKTMLWRACREAMPTKQSLYRHKIVEDDLCVRCRVASENSLHALWTCPELDLVWAELELWSFRSGFQFFNFKELLSWLIMHNQQLELFAVTAWSIWNQRNRVRRNQQADVIHQIAHLSRTWLAAFHARQVSHGAQVIHIQPTSCRWKPPPSCLFKINFDGVVCQRNKKSGIGVVIKDSKGLVIASCSKAVHQTLDNLDIEAMAAAWALSFASDAGVKCVVLEGDSMAVITGLRENESLLVPCGLLLEDAKILSRQFDELHYSHTKRGGNDLAHSLARYAVSILNFLVWMEDVPSQFLSVLQTDLSGLF